MTFFSFNPPDEQLTTTVTMCRGYNKSNMEPTSQDRALTWDQFQVWGIFVSHVFMAGSPLSPTVPVRPFRILYSLSMRLQSVVLLLGW